MFLPASSCGSILPARSVCCIEMPSPLLFYASVQKKREWRAVYVLIKVDELVTQQTMAIERLATVGMRVAGKGKE